MLSTTAAITSRAERRGDGAAVSAWVGDMASVLGRAVGPFVRPNRRRRTSRLIMWRRRFRGHWGFPRFLQIRGDVKVRFGEFTLDSEARRLIRRGGDVHLSPKAFDLLRLLIEHRPNVLDKAALHAQIWPRTFVVDATLSVLVAELRRALADNAREPRFIRTVHALGYSFCGEIA